MQLTNEQWDKYVVKYGRLMKKISHMISGDTMLANAEDNYADLCIGALESIEGFHKKTGLSVDDMLESEMFDKYTKTCLWTTKARKGIAYTERMPFRNRHISFSELEGEDGSVFDIADTSALSRSEAMIEVNDMVNTYDYRVKRVINELRANPGLITENNKIKISSLAKKSGVSISMVRKVIKYLKVANEKEMQIT